MGQPTKAAIQQFQQAVSLENRGDLTAAEAAYRQALKQSPGFMEANANLGTLLLDQGRFKEATAAFRKALKVQPDHPYLLNNMGFLLTRQGEFSKALGLLEKAVAKSPEFALAHANLGNVQRGLGRADLALDNYRRAHELAPAETDFQINLAAVYLELGEFRLSADWYRQAIANGVTGAEVSKAHCRALSLDGQVDAALECYRQVRSALPDDDTVLIAMANTLSDAGRLGEAREAFAAARQMNPLATEAWYGESSLMRFNEVDERVRGMEALLDDPGLGDSGRVDLHFALARVYEQLADFPKAAEHLQRGGRYKRRIVRSSIDQDRRVMARAASLFSADRLASVGAHGCEDATPVFILGMPRSGTSLVEQILASHPQVHGAGELHHLRNVARELGIGGSWQDAGKRIAQLDGRVLTEAGRRYVDGIRRLDAGALRITDKMPANFLYVGLISLILPQARIIHCEREPMDNCLSVYKTLFRDGHTWSYDMGDVGAYYQAYRELMLHWRQVLPGRMLSVHYEALVDDQEGQTRRLLDHCGLAWNEACLDFHKTSRRVATASNAQVRQPIYRDSLSLSERYAESLDPLRRALGPVLADR